MSKMVCEGDVIGHSVRTSLLWANGKPEWAEERLIVLQVNSLTKNYLDGIFMGPSGSIRRGNVYLQDCWLIEIEIDQNV